MQRNPYYSREGRKLTVRQWAALLEKPEYKRVAETTLPNGCWVSTVWLGLDHRWGEGPPLIFETMVFPSHGDFVELDCDRYSTETDAREGHLAMVAKWTAREVKLDAPTDPPAES